MKKESEFGKGLTYNIGLFLAHTAKPQIEISGKKDYSLWFNAAADHLYEIEIPNNFKTALMMRIVKFQKKCLHWKLRPATEKDFEWAINEAKSILFEIDTTMGIEVIKASFD